MVNWPLNGTSGLHTCTCDMQHQRLVSIWELCTSRTMGSNCIVYRLRSSVVVSFTVCMFT